MKESSGLRKGQRLLRGEKLDAALAEHLCSLREANAPARAFTVAVLARSLGLGSRNSLGNAKRKAMIAAARIPSLRAGISSGSSLESRFSTLQARCRQLELEVETLELQFIHVAVNAHRMGYRPEVLLAALQLPVRENENLLIAAKAYLNELGLLIPLESNPR